jgi:hypothetical protein
VFGSITKKGFTYFTEKECGYKDFHKKCYNFYIDCPFNKLYTYTYHDYCNY